MARKDEPPWVEGYRQTTGHDPPGYPSSSTAKAWEVGARAWWLVVAAVCLIAVIGGLILLGLILLG